MATRDEVRVHLDDVDFPADKDRIVEVAERSGAPEDVVKALRAMPPVEYANRGEVLQSARTEEPQDLRRAAAQTRDPHTRIAQGDRDPGDTEPLH